MAKAYRRRNYFVLKNFQTRFILPFLAASFLANIIAVTLFIILARKKIDSVLFSMRLPVTSAGVLLSQPAFIACIIAAVAVSLLFLVVFHAMYQKIDDSLRYLGADLQRISAGNLGFRVTLRENDEFRDFGEKINSMAGELGNRFQAFKDQAENMAKVAETLKNPPDPSKTPAARLAIKRATDSLEEQIKAFKL
jgi:methyl-accepting chemotaxis protein